MTRVGQPPNSADPAGQHLLNIAQPENSEAWHPFPVYDVCYRTTDQYMDPWPLAEAAEWTVVAGSDLQLQCERRQVRSDTRDRWKELLSNGNQWLVRSYDGNGNPLHVLGQFRSPDAAVQALPTLLIVAHMLYPNFLLMPRDAKPPWEDAATVCGT